MLYTGCSYCLLTLLVFAKSQWNAWKRKLIFFIKDILWSHAYNESEMLSIKENTTLELG